MPILAWALALVALEQDGAGLVIAALARELEMPYKTCWNAIERLRQLVSSRNGELDILYRMISDALSVTDIADSTQNGSVLSFGVLDLIDNSLSPGNR